MSRLCGLCQKSANQTCSSCNQIYYCSKQHQKEDWNKHKLICKPYKIERNEKLGRFLQASRIINPGTIILKAKPLILGPKTVSPPLCLACHKKLNLEQNRFDCPKCHWPVCDVKCQNLPQHQLECAIFAKSKFKPQIKNDTSKQSVYSSISILRALLLKQNDPEKFTELLDSESHLDKHLSTQLYQILKNSLVPFLQKVLKLDSSEDEILTICSIFDTNCFDVRLNNVHVKGLYPVVSLASHDCHHNTKHTFDDNFELILYATRVIQKGDLITTTYTQTLWGTLERKEHIRMSKLFDCSCKRCTDPTELGTFVGSFLCLSCNFGKLISCDTLNTEADWCCNNCGHTVSYNEVIWKNKALKKEISEIDKTKAENLERFLEKYKSVLHATNGFVLQVKYALNELYGIDLKTLSQKFLNRKLQLCEELLEVANVLEPCYTKLRGQLLFDIFEINNLKACRNNEVLNELDVKNFMEARDILRVEPDYRKKIVEIEKFLN